MSVTTTCSCLMALALTGMMTDFYENDKKKGWLTAFRKVMVARWESAGLKPDNAFTTSLVLRAYSFLTQIPDSDSSIGVLTHKYRTSLDKGFIPRTINAIARDRLDDFPDSFVVQGYPVSSAVVYWYVDGIYRAGIRIRRQKWKSLCNWAADTFHQQLAFVSADYDLRMDPTALAMTCCLCAKLRNIAQAGACGCDPLNAGGLPAQRELTYAINLFFIKQDTSGIWPKYFPIFHYPEAGANFCFAFEILEAVLCEFGGSEDSIAANTDTLPRLERAVHWCEQNRLRYQDGAKIYYGWNSGGETESLNRGLPESWPTATVHMFLWELTHVLSNEIQKSIVRLYSASPAAQSDKLWQELQDISLPSNMRRQTLKSLIEHEIIKPAKNASQGSTQKRRLSALLFGPPGTSKTQLAWAVAYRLGWPLLQLDPSHFLQGGLEGIYTRADEVFRDLMDLRQVVVLFDEMDALVRTRSDSAIPLDVTSQFLTTSMLPKLAHLHDNRSVIFFMATNYQDRFDAAIKRSGRFDVLLCVGPPLLREKLRNLHVFLGEPQTTPGIKRVAATIERHCVSESKLRKQLELLTYGDFKALVEALAKSATPGELATKLDGFSASEFRDFVLEWCEHATLRLIDDEIRTSTGKRPKNYREIEETGGSHYLRYLLDKKESRLQ